MEWNQTYDAIGGRDYAPYVIQASDGGYVLVGRTQSSVVEGYDCWLIKTDSSGNTEWNRTYTLSRKGDWCNCMIQTKDGSYLLGGIKSYNLMSLTKTDSSGNMQWNQTYGYGATNSVIQTSDGGYALAGHKLTSFPTFCLVKTDEVGIISEFPVWTYLMILLGAVMAVTFVYKRNLRSITQ